jgi:hypothetical protein
VSTTQARARVAVLSRHHPHDHPELIAARRQLRDIVLIDSITKALAKAGPIPADLKRQAAALVDATEVAA